MYDVELNGVQLAIEETELGLELAEFSPTDLAATCPRLGEPTSEEESLSRFQRRALAPGVRVYCVPSGLTGTIVEGRHVAGKRVFDVRYDLGYVRPELASNLRAALPGETTGARGLTPDDPFFAEQQRLMARRPAT